MITVLHLSYYNSSWYLWGEKSPDEGRPERCGRKRKMKEGEASTSPFDASVEVLGQALAAAGLEESLAEAKARVMEIWLPTFSGRPIPSNPLIGEQPDAENNTSVVLQPWKVTTVSLTDSEAVTLLMRVQMVPDNKGIGRRTLMPGLVVSKDLSYWTQVLRYCGSLVARERFLPGIKKKNNLYFAHWEPVLIGNDLNLLRTLSEAMPSVCRAMTEKSEAPTASFFAVLLEAAGSLLDAVIRMGQQSDFSEKTDLANLHDQWLAALRAPVGIMAHQGNKNGLERFLAQVQEWQRKVYYLSNAPFRICFRLEEPCADDKWSVHYLLQAVDDPSLIIPVEEAWKARGKKAQPFKERNVSVRELVLTALGQVAGICPHIEESLRAPVPRGYSLDNAGAYDFLTSKVQLLEQNGFILQMPGWWTKKGSRPGLKARARLNSGKMQASAGLSLERVIAFDWEIALGEEALTDLELKTLAQMKSGLVKLRGQWVIVDASKIKAILDEQQKKGTRYLSAGEAVRIALGAASVPGDLDYAGVAAEGWLKDLLESLEGHTPWQEIPPPQGFRGQMRPYQVRGYSWLNFLSQWGFGACLADDMGLGKTIQTLALLQFNREKGEKNPALLVCPTSLLSNWQKETARFTPELSVWVHHGTARIKGSKRFEQEVKRHAVVLTSYGLLQRDKEMFRKIQWSGLILDEAQNIKNANTRQAQAAYSVMAGYRIALTGTPVENNIGDLWSLMQFMNPGLLGTQAGFKRNFFIPIQVNRNEQTAEKLKRLTGPFILRRMKTDKTIINDLPEKQEIKVFCNLTQEQASLYQSVIQEVEEGLEGAEGIERKGLILAALTKLKQVCNHPAQFLQDNSILAGRSGKMQRLLEMCEEILESGERVLLFTQFAAMGDILRHCLEETFGYQVPFLHGGVPLKTRNRLVEAFQSESGPPFLILTLKVGGTGLNLTHASHVFHFDRWWNPAVEDQATDRAFRIGQKRNVQVYKYVVAGTIEEQIDEMIEQKKEMAGRIVGSGENWLTELSTDDLRKIWALRPGMVSE